MALTSVCYVPLFQLLPRKLFFLWTFLMVINRKTKQETVLIRTGKKNNFKNKNRDTQNDGFISISIRLSKELREQSAVQVQITTF